jgi:predicted Zn-dependent protease
MNPFVRKILICLIVMGVVAGVAWSGRRAYKRASERRLLADAQRYLKNNDPGNAGLCLQRALQINPMSINANKATADMLEAAGSPAALSWRIRTYLLATNNVEFRFEWARTALKMQDLPSVVQALSGIDEKSRSTAAFHKLAGGLAWGLHDSVDAEKQYREALRLEPTNEVTILDLATVLMASTNAAIADAARSDLEKIPTNSPLRVIALRHLIADAAAHHSLSRAAEYSQELVQLPGAAFSEKVARLQLLEKVQSPDYPKWQATLEEEARKSSVNAYTLGSWKLSEEGPTNTFRWLQGLPVVIQTNQPVPLLWTDCLIDLKDWNQLLAEVADRDWGELNYYRFCLISLANRQLGQNRAADASWKKAVSLSSHRLDSLTRLSRVTAVWKWGLERDEVLQKVVTEFPKEKWAGTELIAALYSDGKTRELSEWLVKMQSSDPSDNRLKNNLATVSLLRRSDLDRAFRLAAEAYNSSTNDPFFISTYAYSLLIQQKPEDAVRVLGNLKLEYLKIPSIAAYYGVVEAETGHKEAALEPLKLAQSSRLLPEELEMVRQAKSRL